VVSWGIKISNLQAELGATGRIIVSTIPLGDTVPAYQNLANPVLSVDCMNSLTGMAPGTLCSSNTLELPTAIELAV